MPGATNVVFFKLFVSTKQIDMCHIPQLSLYPGPVPRGAADLPEQNGDVYNPNVERLDEAKELCWDETLSTMKFAGERIFFNLEF
jgi:hypothetical protein